MGHIIDIMSITLFYSIFINFNEYHNKLFYKLKMSRTIVPVTLSELEFINQIKSFFWFKRGTI